MSPVEYAVVCVVLALAAALQGGVGFGMNLLAAPALVLADPALVPGPLILCAMSLTLLMARRDLADVDWSGFGWVMVGRLPGTAAGALLIASISAGGVAIAVGLAVLVAAALNLRDLGLRPTRGTLLGAGIASGFAGTVSSIGGPMLAVVYAHERGPVIRGTLSAIFVAASVISASALALVGRLGTQELLLALSLQPAVIIGYLSSRQLAAHLDAGRTKAAVLTVSVVGAIAAIVSALV